MATWRAWEGDVVSPARAPWILDTEARARARGRGAVSRCWTATAWLSIRASCRVAFRFGAPCPRQLGPHAKRLGFVCVRAAALACVRAWLRLFIGFWLSGCRWTARAAHWVNWFYFYDHGGRRSACFCRGLVNKLCDMVWRFWLFMDGTGVLEMDCTIHESELQYNSVRCIQRLKSICDTSRIKFKNQPCASLKGRNSSYFLRFILQRHFSITHIYIYIYN